MDSTFANKATWLRLAIAVAVIGLSVAAAYPLWHTPMTIAATILQPFSHTSLNV